MFAEGPANVSVKPPFPAPADVTVPAKPGIALTAAATLAFVDHEAAVAEHRGVVASDLDLERVAGGRRVEAGQRHLLLLVAALERCRDSGGCCSGRG